ncbi:MAG: outer membrane beta-barrel protein [Myxococcaceae bacterium]
MSRSTIKSAVLMFALFSLPAAAKEQHAKFFSVALKGGAGTYTGDLYNFSKWSPTWGLNFGFQFMNWLGLEVSYDGSRHQADLNAIGVSGLPDTAFWRHGGTALLKFSAPLGVFRPFAGLGFGVFSTTPTTDGSGLFQGDLYFEAPLAAGFEFPVGIVIFGVRGTYRFLLGTGFIRQGTASVNGGLVDVQGTFGFQF